MQAMVIGQYGGPEQLILKDIPVPQEGEVLILVRAFGINRAETYMRRGESLAFNPLLQMLSGVDLSFYGSFMLGPPEFPLQEIVSIMGARSASFTPMRCWSAIWRIALWVAHRSSLDHTLVVVSS